MIILLDGPKGAGKTSVSNILTERLDNFATLSLDIERHALPDRSKSRTEQNREAFEVIKSKACNLLDEGRNIIVDCGLLKERIEFFEQLAKDRQAALCKFFLKASRETLLGRVRSRDAAQGNETDVERFDETLKIVQDKDFSDFIIIEADNVSVEEVVDKIMRVIK